MSEGKTVIICCDGTWNKPAADFSDGDTSTNVARLALNLAEKDDAGRKQWKHYVAGVGSGGKDRIRGGAFGWGLSGKMMDAYAYLVRNYDAGDRLFFFGFSRGAYTARSLAGMLRNCGVLSRVDERGRALPDGEMRRRMKLALQVYRARGEDSHPDSPAARLFRQTFSLQDTGHAAERARMAADGGSPVAPDIPLIEMVGVWDTVGALGVPFLRHKLARLLGCNWEFHDVRLSTSIRHAYHAVAIHDRRTDFQPVLWLQTPRAMKSGQVLEQVWFNGVHADVGGGYKQRGLSDVSLLWMIEKAELLGLGFEPDFKRSLAPNPLARQHESFAGFFQKLDRWRGKGLGTSRVFHKAIPVTDRPLVGVGPGEPPVDIEECRFHEKLHESVMKRFAAGLRDFPPSVLAEILEQRREQAQAAPVQPSARSTRVKKA